MFSCKDITERASDYVDRRMSLVERMQYRLHVFICHRCREYLDQFRAMIAALRSARRAPAPESVDETVANLLRERNSGGGN